MCSDEMDVDELVVDGMNDREMSSDEMVDGGRSLMGWLLMR